MERPKKPKTVEIVRSDYQPTKSELEEELEPLDVPGKTVNERMKTLARELLQPVKLRRIDRPRKTTLLQSASLFDIIPVKS